MGDEGRGERRRGDYKVDHAGTLSESFIETWPDLEAGREGGCFNLSHFSWFRKMTLTNSVYFVISGTACCGV